MRFMHHHFRRLIVNRIRPFGEKYRLPDGVGMRYTAFIKQTRREYHAQFGQHSGGI